MLDAVCEFGCSYFSKLFFDSFVDISFNLSPGHLFFLLLFSSLELDPESELKILIVAFFDLTKYEVEKLVNLIVGRGFNLHHKL